MERGRQYHRGPEDFAAKQRHFRQLAGVVRRSQHNDEFLLVLVQWGIGGGGRPTALFPQATLQDRLLARDAYVQQKTEENSRAIGRNDLSGTAFKVGFYDMAFAQVLWSQNETRRMPNRLTPFPNAAETSIIARGKQIFSTEVDQGGAGCASCHRNGKTMVNGVPNDTFQDYNIHEPGVVAETTVDNDGVLLRLGDDYLHQAFGPPQDVGGRQNISSRNTKHLRSFWDSVPRWLHHGSAPTVREILFRRILLCCLQESAVLTSAQFAPIAAAEWPRTSWADPHYPPDGSSDHHGR